LETMRSTHYPSNLEHRLQFFVLPWLVAALVLNRAVESAYPTLAQNATGWIITALLPLILTAIGLSIGVKQCVDRPIHRMTDVLHDIQNGSMDLRIAHRTRDALGRLAGAIDAALDYFIHDIYEKHQKNLTEMETSIRHLREEIRGLSEGDLTVRAELKGSVTDPIAESFNDMAEQLSEVVRNVKDVTLQVIHISQEVSRETENLAETSEMQAVQVSDAIEAIQDMSTSIQQVAKNAAQSTAVSEQSTLHAKEGAKAVGNTSVAMESIRAHTQETALAIKRLGESSQEIGNIVQLINDIADRTSILALNASIQAAMAGDAGRGFAVVADEVQRLAERSANATKQIGTLIKTIQKEITEAGASMEESIRRVIEGSRLADGARDKLHEIETVSARLRDLIQSISEASGQQAAASEEIAKTMEEVGEISSQTSAASRRTAASIKSLAQISAHLNESVSSIFMLNDR